MAERSETAAVSAPPGLTITRVFDAPRELVWKAWTERERVMHWLGPRDFTALEFEMDRRPGGSWHARMRAPDGTEYANGGAVRDVAEPERLVFTFAWDGEDGNPGPETLVTITLAERAGKTEMTFTQTGFESAADRDGHGGGWNESFDKLAELLVRA